MGRSTCYSEIAKKTRGEIIEELFEFDKTPFSHNINIEETLKNQ